MLKKRRIINLKKRILRGREKNRFENEASVVEGTKKKKNAINVATVITIFAQVRIKRSTYILRSENARLAKPLPGNDFLLSQCKRSTRDRRYESEVTVASTVYPWMMTGDDDD